MLIADLDVVLGVYLVYVFKNYSIRDEGLVKIWSCIFVHVQLQEPYCSRRAPGNFTLIGGEAPPIAHDSSGAACTFN